MQSFKSAIYQHYVAFHTAHLHGRTSLEDMRRSFPVNRYYFGPFLPVSRDAAILDIGCGHGGFVYWLQQSGYPHSIGVDLSEEQISTGQALGIEGLYRTDLSEFLKTTGQSYDLIVARDVFEHFTRQEFFETLSLIRSRLKPTGRFVLQSPNGQGIHFQHYYFSDITHETVFSESACRQLGLAAGFSKVNAYPVNPYPGSAGGKLRAALWKCRVWHARFWKAVETGSGSGIFTANLIAEFLP